MTRRTKPLRPPATETADTPSGQKHFAVIGAGIAGITCARTLLQAGHRVTVFEKSAGVAGRMATRDSAFGSFDHGAQYFTVRDPRFALALDTAKGVSRPWSATTVRVLDTFGRVAAAGLAAREPHWVPSPGMNALVRRWAQPLAASTELETQVTRIERDALNRQQWQLRTTGTPGTPDAQHVFSGFDGVMLAIPNPQAHALLQASSLLPRMAQQIAKVEVAPCWTLMLAFPQAIATRIGPQWNAARSTHHRIAWLARESSKPGREQIERWTLQASAAWSREHENDSAERVTAKLLKAFAEVAGIRATPAWTDARLWRQAQTLKPLGRPYVWDAARGIGLCGDWCIGHRVEDAFVSGLELALAVHG